jgi:hypothetical protein
VELPNNTAAPRNMLRRLTDFFVIGCSTRDIFCGFNAEASESVRHANY